MKLRVKFYEIMHKLIDIEPTDEDAEIICKYMLEPNPTWQMLCDARQAVRRSKVIKSETMMDDSDVIHVKHLES